MEGPSFWSGLRLYHRWKRWWRDVSHSFRLPYLFAYTDGIAGIAREFRFIERHSRRVIVCASCHAMGSGCIGGLR